MLISGIIHSVESFFLCKYVLANFEEFCFLPHQHYLNISSFRITSSARESFGDAINVTYSQRLTPTIFWNIASNRLMKKDGMGVTQRRTTLDVSVVRVAKRRRAGKRGPRLHLGRQC